MLETIYNTGYSSSELVSHVFSGCPILCNIHPKKIIEETDEETIKTFYSICLFNFHLLSGNKNILLSNIKFSDNFKKSIQFPTEKTKLAADNYMEWFKMCLNLKYLYHFKEELGLELFHLFSSLSEKYNEKESEMFWKKCKPNYGSISIVFSIIDKYKEPEAKMPDRKELVRKTFFPQTKIRKLNAEKIYSLL